MTSRAQIAVRIEIGFVALGIAGFAAGGSSSDKSSSSVSSATATTPTAAKPARTTTPVLPPAKTTPTSTTPANSAKADALYKYTAGLDVKLAQCISGLHDTAGTLKQALPSASTANYVTLYAAASKTKTSCNYSDSTFSRYNPPSGFPSLAAAAYHGFGRQIQHWAQTDNSRLLTDIETVAYDPYGTAGGASLLTDSQQADADAQVIENQLKAAAKSVGLTSFTGPGLPIWGFTKGHKLTC